MFDHELPVIKHRQRIDLDDNLTHRIVRFVRPEEQTGSNSASVGQIDVEPDVNDKKTAQLGADSSSR